MLNYKNILENNRTKIWGARARQGVLRCDARSIINLYKEKLFNLTLSKSTFTRQNTLYKDERTNCRTG